MKGFLSREVVGRNAPVLVCLAMILILLALPTGFEGALNYQEAERCSALVLSTDDSAIVDTGLVRSGEQLCELEILDGRFKGRTVTGVNMLNGSLEQDKIFSPRGQGPSGGQPRRRHHHKCDHVRPLPAGLGNGVGGGLCSVSYSVCRAHRGPGHCLLCADCAGFVEAVSAPVP